MGKTEETNISNDSIQIVLVERSCLCGSGRTTNSALCLFLLVISFQLGRFPPFLLGCKKKGPFIIQTVEPFVCPLKFLTIQSVRFSQSAKATWSFAVSESGKKIWAQQRLLASLCYSTWRSHKAVRAGQNKNCNQLWSQCVCLQHISLSWMSELI